MQLFIKVVLSVVVILTATAVGKKFPSVAGLIGVMPLTGTLVLVWVYLENNGHPPTMQAFARGAVWGIVPSMLFFLAALFCLKRNLPLPIILAASFGVWLIGAFVHQWILKP